MSENEFFGICIVACYVLYPILTLILCLLNVIQYGGDYNNFAEDNEALAMGWMIAPITSTLFFVTIIFRLIFLFFLGLVKIFYGVLFWLTNSKHDDI